MGVLSRLQGLPTVAILCLASGVALLATADAAEHSLPDEAVLASQSYWSSHFGELLRQGDGSGCSKAYAEGASLYLALAPGASELQKAAAWKETQVVRGQKDLEQFWNHLVEVLGKSYDADADTGAFAPRKFVVNDDTVVVSGKVAFGPASGKRLSQTWTREGSEWKIANEMLEIEDYQPPKKEGAPAEAVQEAGKIAEEAVKAEEKTGGSVTKEAEAIGKGLLGGLGKELSSEVKKEESKDIEEKKEEEKKKEEGSESSAPIAAAEKKSHGSFTTVLMVVVIGGGLAAWAMRRSRRKNEAVIAGFDAMLG